MTDIETVDNSIEFFSPEIKLDLGDLYGSNKERTEFTLNFYKHLYSLPILQFNDYVTEELFEYCKKREFFINILAFQERRIFLKRVLHDRLMWGLPGSSVRSEGKELFEDAVSRILQTDVPTIEMSELCPVAYVQKRYFYLDESVTHHGIAFMGRVRSPSYSAIEKDESIKGRFVSIADLRERMRLSRFEQMLISLGVQLLSQFPRRNIEAIDQEIESTDRISSFVLKIHNKVIRPIGRLFGSRIIKREILKYIDDGSKILDIACGDDDFIFELSEKGTLCIGNDIHWRQIKSLASRTDKSRQNIIFTNHDACNLPFKLSFDVSICKNLLHHMGNVGSLTALLNSIQKVSKKILIVDPEEPKKGGLHARIWNIYYRKILKDQGERFYSRARFEKTLKDFFKHSTSIKFKYVSTIKGTFMFCFIDLKEDQLVDAPGAKVPTEGGSKQIESEKNIKGIIFDLDGLIVDSESVFFRALRDTLAAREVEVSEAQYIENDLQNGKSLIWQLKEIGKVEDTEQVEKEVYSRYSKYLSENISPMPGALETLERLRIDYRIALASSSKREFIDLILDHLNLKSTFEVIIAREDVTKHKPDPECLELALKKMGLNANQCLVVEDAKRGVIAARALNAKVVVVPSKLTYNEDFGDVFVMDSLIQLTKELIYTFEAPNP